MNDQPSWTAWCSTSTRVQRRSPRRIRVSRSIGAVAVEIRAITRSRAVAAQARSSSRRSTSSNGVATRSRTSCTGSPSRSTSSVRSTSWRSIRSARAPCIAAASSSPSKWTRQANWKEALSGFIRSNSQARRWAKVAGAGPGSLERTSGGLPPPAAATSICAASPRGVGARKTAAMSRPVPSCSRSRPSSWIASSESAPRWK